jgi:Na+-transporting NADH:ubiquinone oxidoreductase subunit NqrB
MQVAVIPVQSPMKISLKSIFKDARHFQILFLSGFLLFGCLFLGWSVDISKYLITIASCLMVQYFFIIKENRDLSSLKSAMITALSLCILLKANNNTVYLLAAALAIGSKFILKSQGKHFFNPANFGIVLAVLLTGNAWVSPGQWGNAPVVFFLVGAAGLMMVFKVGRVDTCLAFLLTFAVLEYARTIWYLGWETDVFLHKMTSGTLMLFAFFMITDPVTTPKSKVSRLVWSGILATLTFALTNWFYVHTAPIYALFIVSPLTVFFNKYSNQPQFKWIKS